MHLFFHSWSKWEDCKVNTVFIYDGYRKVDSQGQKRHCVICNKKQIRSL
jgi:hypothetical protein